MKFKQLIKLYYSGELTILFFREERVKTYWVILPDCEPTERYKYKISYLYGYHYIRHINGVEKVRKSHRDVDMFLPNWFLNKLKFK